MKAIVAGKSVKAAAEQVKKVISTVDIDVSKVISDKIPALKPFPRLVGSVRPNWVEFKDFGDKYFSEFGMGKIEESPLGLELCPKYLRQVRGMSLEYHFYKVYFSRRQF